MTNTDTKKLLLKPLGIERPEKIRWRYPSNPDVISTIKSKTTRSFLKNFQHALDDFDIVFHHQVLGLTEYLAWLPYYEKKMIEANYTVFANKDWFQQKTLEGKKVEAIFFYQHQSLCGSIVYTTKDGIYADACFKASEKLPDISKKRHSIGAIIDYLFLRDVTERKFSNISMGRSRNAFGVINSLGYLDYKLRFGCIPDVEPGFPNLDFVPVNENGNVAFFGIQDQILSLFICSPENSPLESDLIRFNQPPDLLVKTLLY